MTNLNEKLTVLTNLVGDIERQSRMIELISDKMIDVQAIVGLNGQNIPNEEHRRERLGKDVVNCMSALEGVNKALIDTLEKLNAATSEIEFAIPKEAN